MKKSKILALTLALALTAGALGGCMTSGSVVYRNSAGTVVDADQETSSGSISFRASDSATLDEFKTFDENRDNYSLTVSSSSSATISRKNEDGTTTPAQKTTDITVSDFNWPTYGPPADDATDPPARPAVTITVRWRGLEPGTYELDVSDISIDYRANDNAGVETHSLSIVSRDELTFTVLPGSTTPDSAYFYSITARAEHGGTITPEHSTSVQEGHSQTYTIRPDEGYVLTDVLVDGKSVGAVTEYTFDHVSADHRIEAHFIAADKPEAPALTDVAADAWYAADVAFVTEQGLMPTENGTFAPDEPTTRATLVYALWQLAGAPVVNYLLPFADVAEDSAYAEAVRWAAAEGIVAGVDATTFVPDASVTREQTAALLYRFAKHQGQDVSVGEDTNILSFADALTVSDYAFPALQWACGSGLLQGDEAGNLLPGGTCTRAHMAALLHRLAQPMTESAE